MTETTQNRHLEPEAVLAVGSFLLFGIIAVAVLYHVVPAENEKYAMLMLGALIGIVKDTFGRYFQATKGAQEQRKEAAEVARTLAETAATIATSTGSTTAADGTVALAPGESVKVAAEGEEDPDPTMFGGPRA